MASDLNAEPTADRFRRLFADTERELLAYVLRRVDRPEDAADVVSSARTASAAAGGPRRPL
jgi:DNA-directed RNA polymerase specialized sigma24 family protein